jgi:hypothetical protein
MTSETIRPGFAEISSGWMIVDCFAELSDRIDRLARWQKVNGPLNDTEKATIELMIESQIARGIRRGDFAPFILGSR